MTFLDWKRVMATGGAEGVRAYLRTLRQERGISHQRLAKAIGYNKRSLIGWEQGVAKKGTNELRQTVFVRAVVALGGSWDHIVEIVKTDAGAARGEELALSCLSEKQEGLIAPYLATDEGVSDLLEAIDGYRDDKRKVGQVIGFAKGLASRVRRGPAARYKKPSRQKQLP